MGGAGPVRMACGPAIAVATIAACGWAAGDASALPANIDQLRTATETEGVSPLDSEAVERPGAGAAGRMPRRPSCRICPFFDARPAPGTGYGPSGRLGPGRGRRARDAPAARSGWRGRDRPGHRDAATGRAAGIADDGGLRCRPGADRARIRRAQPGAVPARAQPISDTLELTDRYTAPGGITTMHWHQSVDGIELVNEELAANVDADGRLLNVIGPAPPGNRGHRHDPGHRRRRGPRPRRGRRRRDRLDRGAEGPDGGASAVEFAGGDKAHLVLYGDAERAAAGLGGRGRRRLPALLPVRHRRRRRQHL